MARKLNNIEKFWQELKRRKVTHVITGYAATAFVILQLVDIVVQPLHLPAWTLTSLIIILCAGFLVVVVLSWNYDFTASGIKKTRYDNVAEQKEQVTIKSISGWQVATYISLFIIVVLIAFNFVTNRRLSNEINTSEKSIAVLPFKLLSDEPDKQYLADGMMDAILLNLSKIKALRVMSRTSVEQYRETNKTIPAIGQELDVEYILEGSFQKSGENVRLIVQLIKTKKENHLWANEYNRNWNDIFSVQSEVARTIAGELKTVITPEVKKLIDKKPTNNMAAYDAYLMGQFYWRKITKNDIETSLKYFQLAVEKDPGSALGYAGIADVWIGLQQIGAVSPEEAGPKAEASALKAIELDSTRAEVHYTLALMEYAVKWDWERSESEFKKTIELNPNHADARAYYSHFLTFFGRNDEAMKQIEKAMELDPLNLLIRGIYGLDLIAFHRCDEALVIFQEILKVDSVHSIARSNLVSAYYCSGRYIEALKALMHDTKVPENKEIFRQAIPKGDFTGANRLAAEVLVKQSKTTYIRPTRIANRYAMAGDKDKAIDWLEKAFEGRDPSLVFLLYPNYDILRDDPRFQEIARKMNLPYK